MSAVDWCIARPQFFLKTKTYFEASVVPTRRVGVSARRSWGISRLKCVEVALASRFWAEPIGVAWKSPGLGLSAGSRVLRRGQPRSKARCKKRESDDEEDAKDGGDDAKDDMKSLKDIRAVEPLAQKVRQAVERLVLDTAEFLQACRFGCSMPC